MRLAVCWIAWMTVLAAPRIAGDFQHADVYLKDSPTGLVFGNAKVELAFGKTHGEWLSMKAGGGPIFTAEEPSPAVDFRVEDVWMVEKHGARFERHTIAWDQRKGAVSLTLVLGVGPMGPEWGLISERWRARTSPQAPAGAPVEYELAITYSLYPGEGRLERSARVTRLAGQNLLKSSQRKFEGFLFQLPDAAVGAPADCTIDIPGPFFPASYVRPGTPYEKLLNRYQGFHSAPDAGFGIFAIENRREGKALGSWMETGGEVAYLSYLSGNSRRITFLHYDLRTVRLFRRSTVQSDLHHVSFVKGGTPEVLARFREMAARAMPLDTATPAWASEMVVLEAMPSYFPGGIRGLTKRLPFYREVGFNTLYLMPHYKGGYSPIDPFAVDPAIGTAEDLKEMVRAAHALGMHVLFDMVIHGFNTASPLVKERPELFVHDELGYIVPHATWGSSSTDWASPAYRQFMREYVLYDINTYGIDGYRVDAATYKSPNWDPRIPYEPFRSSAAKDLLKGMMGAMREKNPQAILLSEVFGPLYYSVSNSVHDNQTEAVSFLLDRMEKGETTAEDYKLHLANVYAALPAGAKRVLFARNHDTSWFYHFNGYTPRFLAFDAIHALFGIPEVFAGDEKNPPHPDSDPAVFDHYRKLFALRRQWPELTFGEIALREAGGGNPMVFTGLRRGKENSSAVAISLSGKEEEIALEGALSGPDSWLDPIRNETTRAERSKLRLKPFQVLVGRFAAGNK